MDPLGASASLLALLDATFRVVEYLSDLKDGGKERVKLLAEVSYMWCTLDSLKEKLNPNFPQRGLETLDKPGGPFDQCRSIVANLAEELTSKDTMAGRLVQRLRWSFKKEDVNLAVEQLHRIQATIAQQITLAVTEKIQQDSATARQILDEQQEERIKNWLSPLNFVAQQRAIYENHCFGTGARFLQSKQFDGWRKSSNSIMWCRGPPGAGKTYLSSIIAHELQETRQTELEIVLVVYCRYDDPDCQNVANIIGDLLKQCLKGRQVPDALVELFRTHSSTDTRPTCDALLAILFEQLESYRKCYIIIDALDELANPNDRSSLITALRPFQATDGTREATYLKSPCDSSTCSEDLKLSLMIMSRELEDISNAVMAHYCDCCVGTMPVPCNHCEDCVPGFLFAWDYLYNCQSCALPHGTISGGFDACQTCYDAGVRCPEQAHPDMTRRVNNFFYEVSADEEDMRRYLQWRIEKDNSFAVLVKKKDGLQDHVLDAVVRGSGSMFLMAKLTIDAIETCLTIRELKMSLQRIPDGLHVAYDATVQRILRQGEGRSQRAFKVMKWVLLAQRPLASSEMEHAVSIEHGSEDIDPDDVVPATTLASLCAGLVVIDQYGDFRFAHQTVPEYLKASHPDQFYDEDASVANACLTYLLYTTFASGPCADLAAFQEREARYPLYSYCSRHWYKQLNGTLTADQKQLALQFFKSEPLWRSARQAARSRVGEHGDILPRQQLWGDSMMHHAAYLDAHHLFEDLLVEEPQALNKRNGWGRTPLLRAAVHGSLGFASKLIKAGADVNTLDKDGESALHLAVWKKDLAMVDLLVKAPSVDINLRDSKTKSQSGGSTALIRAAGIGTRAIVQRLIEAGADVNVFNNAGYSALHMAAVRGRPEIVDFLLLLGAPEIDINSRSGESLFRGPGASALMLAAQFGHLDVVKMLLKAGADTTITYRNGDAAIHLAVINGHVAVVEALLEFNVELETLREISNTENDRLSPLMLAILHGSMQMLETILGSGRPNINLQSSRGKTALMIAVKAREIKAAKLLLAHEMINVNVVDDDGWTALMAAADIGLSEIIPDLLAKGANVNVQSNSGWSPLLVAADGNHAAVVEMLLAVEGILVNTFGTSDSRTALHYAVAWANAGLVELLLSKGAEPQIRDRMNDFRAVDYALYFKDSNILDLLEAGG